MKLYHLTYLISPTLSEPELKETCQQVETLVQENQGNLQKTERAKKIQLGAPIKKIGSAFMSSLTFYIDKAKIKNLEQKLREVQNLLRFMLVAKIPAKVSKKPVKGFPISKKWTPKKEKKVELKEIEKKLGELLGK